MSAQLKSFKQTEIRGPLIMEVSGESGDLGAQPQSQIKRREEKVLLRKKRRPSSALDFISGISATCHLAECQMWENS